jgi:hypothetical protein
VDFKTQKDHNTGMMGDFNTPLSLIDSHPDKNQQRNSTIE